MEEISLYVKKIEEVINSINFKKIYSYFKKQNVAIYNDGFLYFSSSKIPYNFNLRDSVKALSEFVILNYESLTLDLIVDAGLFIKQMVTNMFYRNRDKRIPNDLLALQYPKIYLNYDYMHYERKLLIKAYHANDNYVKLNYFRMFLNVRDLRRQLVGNDFSMLEYGLETINGLSEYAMYKAIYLLDKKLMKVRLKEITNQFLIASTEYLDFRHSNIYSGLFILILMSDLGFDIEPLFESEQTLYQVVSRKIDFFREPIAFRTDKNLIEKLTEYDNSVSEKFATFFDNTPKRVNGYYQIYAFDPYSIFVDKDNLYHETFVVLKNLLNNELIKIEGPVVTKILDNSYDIVTSYYYIDFKKFRKKQVKK